MPSTTDTAPHRSPYRIQPEEITPGLLVRFENRTLMIRTAAKDKNRWTFTAETVDPRTANSNKTVAEYTADHAKKFTYLTDEQSERFFELWPEYAAML